MVRSIKPHCSLDDSFRTIWSIEPQSLPNLEGLYCRERRRITEQLNNNRDYMQEVLHKIKEEPNGSLLMGKDLKRALKKKIRSDARRMALNEISGKVNFVQSFDSRKVKGIAVKRLEVFVSALYHPGGGREFDSLVIVRPGSKGYSPKSALLQREGKRVYGFVSDIANDMPIIACMYFSRYASFRDLNVEYTNKPIREMAGYPGWKSETFFKAHEESGRVSFSVCQSLRDVHNWDRLLGAISGNEPLVSIGDFNLNLLGFAGGE